MLIYAFCTEKIEKCNKRHNALQLSLGIWVLVQNHSLLKANWKIEDLRYLYVN